MAVFLLVLLLKEKVPTFPWQSGAGSRRQSAARETIAPDFNAVKTTLPSAGGRARQEAPPAPEAGSRLVVRHSQLSLLVKNVRQVQEKVIQEAERMGGYMVSSRVNSSQGVDNGSVTVRVPEIKLNQALTYFRGLGVGVVSENLTGRDVTDEYIDIEARLKTFYRTKSKFEEILDKAEAVPDILTVQRELTSLQQQIDNLKGRQQYLEKSARTSRVTVYLGTDELSLPYSPTQPWRPKVVFKKATRSLVKTFRRAAALGIWTGVYAVIWAPGLAVFYLVVRRKRRS